jgi:hypothetical protein
LLRSVIKSINGSTRPVICWVGPPGGRAASAGAFILVGCPVAAMAEGTNVGAAHPVLSNGGTVSEKVTNDAAAYIRSLADTQHDGPRPPNQRIEVSGARSGEKRVHDLALLCEVGIRTGRAAPGAFPARELAATAASGRGSQRPRRRDGEHVVQDEGEALRRQRLEHDEERGLTESAGPPPRVRCVVDDDDRLGEPGPDVILRRVRRVRGQ